MVYQAERPYPRHRIEAQRSGFDSERRNSGMIRSFRRQPKASGGNEGNEADFDDGPLVKRLRRGPLTPQTWVRFPHGSPKVSTNNDEGPPVPIPNTEVKLISGDDTWLATARENSTALTQRRQLQKCSCDNTCLATDREDSTMPTQMFLNSSVGRARGC